MYQVPSIFRLRLNQCISLTAISKLFISKQNYYCYRQILYNIAITPDNNIVSIFNGGEKRGVLKTLLPVAIQQGGRKLDNYNSQKLSAMYMMYGFNPTSKVKFNSKFAPDDWNYERDGEPDIVFWIHNGDSAEDVVLNFGRYLVPWDAVQEFASYEEASEYRDNIINIIDAFENNQ